MMKVAEKVQGKKEIAGMVKDNADLVDHGDWMCRRWSV